MGAVDLVIRSSRRSRSRAACSGIGRAGHELGAVSKRAGSSPSSAPTCSSRRSSPERMRDGAIEETKIPRNPLDVLAQQIVAICADEEIEVAELHALVRGAYPFADLSRVAARERARHARRPLPVGRVRGAAAADRLGPHRRRRSAGRTGARAARGHERRHDPRPRASSASTSSTAAAASASSTRRWSTRRAQARPFLLGASTWRIEEITRDRVSSRRRPACRARCRSGRARASGRPYELGEAIGAASRELVALPEQRRSRAAATEHSPRRARRAEPAHVPRASSRRRPGAVPSDRTVVVERFRDEIGDWRVCILDAVRRPRACAVGAGARRARCASRSGWRRRRSGRTTGSRIHLPDADAPPSDRPACSWTRTRSRSSSSRELGGRALFGARFRENAARSLLIPRRRPGERTPLWQQRLKAQIAAPGGAQATARSRSSLETYRECLQDVFDLPALKRLLQGCSTREIDLVDVETASASPYRDLAALRLRRDLHVRGRHAALPSAAPRRSRSTATCCASCSGRRSCAT